MDMIAKISFFFFLTFSFSLIASPGDTTRVRVHNAVDMVWNEGYVETAHFPTDGKTYSKILMHYTLACASKGCGDWDYTTKIDLLVPVRGWDSVPTITVHSEQPYVADTTWKLVGKNETFELARVMTPYGSFMRMSKNGFTPEWKHVHTFDVTDYAPLLKGDKVIRAFYDGWSGGYSVTIDFEFIEGIPPREVLEVRNLWQTGVKGWNYLNQADFETNYLKQLTVNFPTDMKGAMLRFIPSGHGFDNTTYCAEFCEKEYYLKVDGKEVGKNAMWRTDCGLNPVYPQGGTWLYDRANWCPGTRAYPFDHELTPFVKVGKKYTIDIDFQEVTWEGKQNPIYILETQLFIYGERNYQVDAALNAIISPSLTDEYKRFNPVCESAEIELKNNGAADLTSVDIAYTVNENDWQLYQWKGRMKTGEKERVKLTVGNALHTLSPNTTPRFNVQLLRPNGVEDERPFDNALSSTFESVPTLPGSMIFYFYTNSKPEESYWELSEANGTILHTSEKDMTAFTLYKTAFSLSKGCYVLKIKDTGRNGLSFWVNQEGNGYLRLMNDKKEVIHSFTPDFGTGIDFYFSVE
jgi:hypothetical protein